MSELSEKHANIALLFFNDSSFVEIAKKYDTSWQVIQTIVKRPDVQKELARLRRQREKRALARYDKILDKVFLSWEEVVKEFVRLATKAKSETVRCKACKDLTEIMRVSTIGKDDSRKLPDIRVLVNKTAKKYEKVS